MKKYFPCVVLIVLFSCASVESRLPPPVEVPVAEIPYDAEIPCEPPLYTLSFIAAGDNLFHISMLNSSLQDGEYNFSPIYTEVRNIVRQADIAFINQETVMAGSRQGYSGYPKFNTPSALAPVLVDAGFTVINHANNHVMDMGEAGILSTLDVWDSIPGVICLGIRRTNEFKPAVVTRNNISLGFLSYTFSTNYIPLPKDKPWMVSMTNRETIAAEIEAIRPLCDFLIVSAHWGDEYEREPNSFQTDLAAFLAARNVDMVIGHHPHVLQRAEYIDRPDGKQTLCFYSLGNFASNQDNKERLLGALSYVVIHKKEDRVSVGDAGLIPVVTHIEPGYMNTKVYPFYEYTDELMESHRLYTRDKNFNMAFYNGWLASLNAKVFMYNPFVQDLP